MTDAEGRLKEGGAPSKEAALRLEIQDLKAQLQGAEHLKIEALRDLQQRLLETQQQALSKEEALTLQRDDTTLRLKETLEALEVLKAECQQLREAQEALRQEWLKGFAENRRLHGGWEEISDDRRRLSEALRAEELQAALKQIELQGVYASRSWRLTRPLRALNGLISKIRKHR